MSSYIHFTNYLTDGNENTEYNCSPSNAKYPVNQETTKEAQNNIWPRIQRIEHCKLAGGDLQIRQHNIL